MRRREFITLFGSAAVAWPVDARGQKAERRVAVLSGFVEAERRPYIDAFKKALAEEGWLEGRNLKIDYRSAEGNADRLPGLAAEVTNGAPDAIVAMATPALVAARDATRTIPIVFVNVSDPVDGGFVVSMARPGGNVTGFTSFEYSIGSKWLELLKEVSPPLTRVLVMLNTKNYTSRALLRTIEAAAPSLSLRTIAADVRRAADIEPSMTAFATESHGGMIVLPDPTTTVPLRTLILPLALQHRLPTVQAFRFFAVAGGLMAYGPDDLDIYRRAGKYVSRILMGTNPKDLPVQNPIQFRLVINLKTAKAIGLAIPEAFLMRADEVIE